MTTTYLDIAHQYEVLDLLAGGRTVVAVLHDLNQAARYATDLVVLRDGRVATTDHPSVCPESSRPTRPAPWWCPVDERTVAPIGG